jgi:hypothetical protein
MAATIRRGGANGRDPMPTIPSGSIKSPAGQKNIALVSRRSTPRAPQHAIGAPVMRELDRRPPEIARLLSFASNRRRAR